MRKRVWSLALVVLTAVLLVPGSARADKLKGFYVGSGGISHVVSRTVIVEFATDGTAIVQQKWIDKGSAEVACALDEKDGNTVTVKFDPVKDQAAMEALVMTFKRGTLTPTSWDSVMGVLGPPKLAPVGGKNDQMTSVQSCRSLASTTGGYRCVMWDSRDSGK